MIRAHWLRLVFATAVLTAAALLRLYGLAQTPPGLYNDEAYFVLRGEELAHGPPYPVYLTSADGAVGSEALFAYLTALVVTGVGPVAWAGRLVAAWAGLLGVALTLRAGREIFPRSPVGLLAGLNLATFYWHINFSRFGAQPILAATAAAGTMAALWWGARTGRRAAFALAGLCLGIGLHTYVAFRLFPLVPLCAGLALLVAGRTRRRALAAGGLLAGGVALALYAPLIAFFIANPNWFLNRFLQTTQGTLGAALPAPALFSQALATIGGLFVQGDSNWRHNLPPRPALDAAQAAFFLIGVGVCLKRWREPRSWALLAWLVVGLTPSALTIEAPHFGRTTMVLPALALLTALGVHTAWHASRSPWARRLVACALALSILLTVRDYFGRWARDPHLFQAFDGEQVWLTQLLASAPEGARLYATPWDFRQYHWTLEYLLGRERFAALRRVDGRACAVLPAATEVGAMVVISGAEARTSAALQGAYPLASRRRVDGPGEGTASLAYWIPPGQAARLSTAVEKGIDFGGLVRLRGYTLFVNEARPGGQLGLEIVWESRQAFPAAYKVFLHLLRSGGAEDGQRYGQTDTEPCQYAYPTWAWLPGDLVIDRYSIPVPPEAPAGDYEILVGWYEAEGSAGARLPVYDEAGQPLTDAVRLTTVHLGGP